MLEWNWRKTEISHVNMTTATIFAVIIFFHCWSVYDDGLQNKTLTVPQDYRAGPLIDICVQHLINVWKELFTKTRFVDVSERMAPDVLFDNFIR